MSECDEVQLGLYFNLKLNDKDVTEVWTSNFKVKILLFQPLQHWWMIEGPLHHKNNPFENIQLT